jgi:RNA methyltransferase, TrmH family
MSDIKVITSLTNDRIKAIRALEHRKERKETGMFVAEGTSLIISARDNGHVPETLVYGDGATESGIVRGLIAWAQKAGADVLQVSEAVLGKLSSKDNPSTVLGVFKQRLAQMPEKIATDATWIALEEVRDPGNLGTIIRTADAAGLGGVVLIGTCCDPFAPETIRATMGSIFAMPIVKVSLEEFASIAKTWPGDLIATHLDGSDDYRARAYRGPELILMGSEGPGLTDEAAALATAKVKIPMSGALDSLNLAIASALMMYQVRADRLKV